MFSLIDTLNEVNREMLHCKIYFLRVILGRNNPSTAKGGGYRRLRSPKKVAYARTIAQKSVSKASSIADVVGSVPVAVVEPVVGRGVGVGSALPDPGMSPAGTDAQRARPSTNARVNRFI